MRAPFTVTIPAKEVDRHKTRLSLLPREFDNKTQETWGTFVKRTEEFSKYIIEKAGKRFKEILTLEDNVVKLKESFDKYPGGEPRTYRLLTSFPVFFANKERLHADSILRSAHIYNRNKLHAHDARFVYVQAIPINKSGMSLSNPVSKKLFLPVAEAALMAEMGVLNSLHQILGLTSSMDRNIHALYEKAETLYRLFLNNSPQGQVYFNKSPEGKEVIKLLEEFRKGPAGKLSPKELTSVAFHLDSKKDNILQLVAQAVKIMFVHNKHLELEYGLLNSTDDSIFRYGRIGL